MKPFIFTDESKITLGEQTYSLKKVKGTDGACLMVTQEIGGIPQEVDRVCFTLDGLKAMYFLLCSDKK